MDKDNKLFKNFVVSPKEFNSPTEVPLPPQVATETPTEEDVVDVPPTNLEGPETTINIYAGTGENSELSNFAERPFIDQTEWQGLSFKSVEGAFQAAKIMFSDMFYDNILTKAGNNLLDKLQEATGAEAKALGQKVTGLNRSEWDRLSSSIMKNLIKDSFEQNPDALAKLLATGDATLTHTQDKTKWGKEFPRLLMEVRDELRGTEPTTQPSTSIKEGVSDLFESNPKLASIGTPEQYSEYLNTIFPESQVKEILYHGSERSEQSFEKQIPREAYGSNAIYFANKSYAKNFGNLIPALLDITSPLISELKFMRRRLKPGIESPPNTIDAKDLLASNKNNDGLIGTDYSEQENNTYVVREPEQIHVLGNEQDIEGFKRFVSQSSTQPNQNSPEGLPPIDRTSDSCG